ASTPIGSSGARAARWRRPRSAHDCCARTPMTDPRDERIESKELDLDEFMRLLPVLDAADLLAISAVYQQANPEPRAAARAVATKVANSRGLIDELGRL